MVTRAHTPPCTRIPRGRGETEEQRPKFLNGLCHQPCPMSIQDNENYSVYAFKSQMIFRNRTAYIPNRSCLRELQYFFPVRGGKKKRFQCITHSIIFSLPNQQEISSQVIKFHPLWSELAGLDSVFWEGWSSVGGPWGHAGRALPGLPLASPRPCFPASPALPRPLLASAAGRVFFGARAARAELS